MLLSVFHFILFNQYLIQIIIEKVQLYRILYEKQDQEGRSTFNERIPQHRSPTGHQTGHVNIYNIFILPEVNFSIKDIKIFVYT
jgi:hypothetical protein